jgi:hypothetical protein
VEPWVKLGVESIDEKDNSKEVWVNGREDGKSPT